MTSCRSPICTASCNVFSRYSVSSLESGSHMVLFVLAFLGGVLTILSPCILPILPFTFARADQPFRRSGLPLLLSMAITFAVVASIAVAGGSWLVRANQYGRIAALVVFALL